ncbi:hypothetical protein [Georgenia sp. AZ-5]|uniref:hypothetical protein n=1 Tax=Georgenia sp. AZ-5 TaxID=3367526 RepID=UPI003754A8EA
MDAFVSYYNDTRPHRSLAGRTPRAAYLARPKAAPLGSPAGKDNRVRTDKIDRQGKVTLRYNGRLHHIGVGRAHARTPVVMVIQDLHITIADATTGEILRRAHPRPHTRLPTPITEKPGPTNVGPGCPGCLATSHSGSGGI